MHSTAKCYFNMGVYWDWLGFAEVAIGGSAALGHFYQNLNLVTENDVITLTLSSCRHLVSLTWSCGLETSGSSLRRRASSLPSCGLRLLRASPPHPMPTASREPMSKTRMPATREATNLTTASRDTTRWADALMMLVTSNLEPQGKSLAKALWQLNLSPDDLFDQNRHL